MGLVCAKNASEKFSRLGTFKKTLGKCTNQVRMPLLNLIVLKPIAVLIFESASLRL
jgi:hypothetical protein